MTDKKFADDASCLDYIRRIFSKLGAYEKAGFDRVASQPPLKNIKDVYGMVATDNSKQYDVREIITRITDNSEFDEYKDSYGQTIICGTARIDGWAVGFVANQRKIVIAKKPGKSKEMQLGGVIYSDSADKAARFIMNCNQRKIPLVFLQDVTGFMVGSRSEQGGIIKDGAKLVNAMSNSVVPKFTVVVGNSYGAGNYAMCGKAYDPRLIVGWPTAQIAVMGGAQAAKTLLQIQVAALKAQGKEISKEEEEEQLKIITDRYNSQISPYYAASRLWLDAVIDPAETRKIISMGIEMSNHAPLTRQYNVGVIQT